MYQDTVLFEKRVKESTNMIEKFSDRIPIIVQKKQETDPEIDKRKFMVPRDLTYGQFTYVVRRRLNIDDKKALFTFCEGSIPLHHDSICTVYDKHKNADGFLYVNYTFENTFGCE